MQRSFVIIGATLALFAVSATPVRADKCTSAKLKAIGKKEAGLLSCQAKVATTGDSSGLSACEAKVSSKFATAFAKAGACAGAESTCDTHASDCETAVSNAMTETLPSKCEAAKRKAAGKLASAELGCYAKAAAKEAPVDEICVTKAVGKFAKAFAKAGACPDGGAPQALVESRCVHALVTTDGTGTVTDVCPMATATTSTVTTSSTTTATTASTTSTTTTTQPQFAASTTCICVWSEPNGFPCSVTTASPTAVCGVTCDQVACGSCPSRPGECSGAATLDLQFACTDVPCD